ncbi:hypothetical protein LWI29_009821 [Acer saccharum]|uniref:Uncharacterized protein n=1 Tax=Acer saccharum TaxID=4024 RepID=A0AA39VYI8_ACESA|nr:hypothetical protein LWI29_009821 [Acer saccharum]
MELSVCIISREIIKPSSPTPNHLRIYNLSPIDLSMKFYRSFILFYSRAPKSFEHLKNSLSKILANYYPFAGRLKDNFIDCDDYGVSFVEARVAGDMSTVLKTPEIDLLGQLLSCKPHEMSATQFNLAIQINYFDCGGVAITFCVGHFIVDATTVAHFIKSWAMVACGGDDIIKDISLFPSQDWFGLLTSNVDPEILNIMAIPPRGESELKEHSSASNEPYPSSSGKITKRFVFDKSKIIAL